ncbi:B12-binding domain-containing radical SAM protein [Nanoarchaeota archaeon]
MKILLISPNCKRKLGKSFRVSPVLYPLGLAYLAAVLRRDKQKVKILDAEALNFKMKQIMDYVESYRPDVVGFSVKTPAVYNVFRMAKKIKEKYPQIKIVVGGPHPSAIPEESAKEEFIDFVVVGEGELTMLELVNELNGKKNFKKINGLVFRNKKNKVIVNKPREQIHDLDALPYPAFDLLPLEKYVSINSKDKKFINILTSRGCPGRCIFCNKRVFGNNCRMRSAKNLIQEIEFLIKTYGYKEFHIVDDLFTNDRQRVIDFCNLVIKKKLRIKWKCGNGVRVGTIDLELLRLMKRSGCYSLSYGIESGNQKILNNLRKGQTLQQCKNAVTLTKKVGIDCIGFFIFGGLGEDKKTMRETLNFAKSLDLDLAQFMIVVPYPGTLIREVIEQEGKLLVDSWEKYDHLEGKAIFEHGKLKAKDMEEMHKKAYKEFYRRPQYLLKKIFKKRTWNEFKGELSGFLALLEM